jgi:hypothetical protein
MVLRGGQEIYTAPPVRLVTMQKLYEVRAEWKRKDRRLSTVIIVLMDEKIHTEKTSKVLTTGASWIVIAAGGGARTAGGIGV